MTGKATMQRWLVAGLIVLIAVCAIRYGQASEVMGDALRRTVGSLKADAAVANPSVRADAALLLDAATGRVLYGKDDRQRMYPASTTKILTAMIVLETLPPDRTLIVGDEARLRTAGESSAGLEEGQKWQVRDLLAALMLPSGNDAARTLARAVVRDKLKRDYPYAQAEQLFAEWMNERARELGAEQSHFVNPHGLHDDNHYTTARDMGWIARAAMESNEFRELVASDSYRSDTAGGDRTFRTRNKLLTADSGYTYKGANGVKTGFTDEAGYCLVASAVRGGKEMISVVLHSTERHVWSDSQTLLQFGFDHG